MRETNKIYSNCSTKMMNWKTVFVLSRGLSDRQQSTLTWNAHLRLSLRTVSFVQGVWMKQIHTGRKPPTCITQSHFRTVYFGLQTLNYSTALKLAQVAITLCTHHLISSTRSQPYNHSKTTIFLESSSSIHYFPHNLQNAALQTAKHSSFPSPSCYLM